MLADVLIIDDDPATVQTVESVLDRVECTLRCAVPEPSLLSSIVREPPDFIILGINDENEGWSLCNQLLDLLDVPLFLLLASSRQADRIRGLNMGAVDCVSKGTCAPLELAARVRAALRRRRLPRRVGGRVSAFVDGDLIIDLGRREVWLAGELVSLTPIEFCLLACLARYAGSILPYDDLLTTVWGPEHTRQPAALRPHIHRLRQKLEPDPAQPQRIVNHRGKGYLLQPIAA